MRTTVAYSRVTKDVAAYMGEAYGLSIEEELLARAKLNLYLPLVWEYYPWPDTKSIEKRIFRAIYNAGTTYNAPSLTSDSETWFPGDLGYYQALVSTTGNAPAVASGPAWLVDYVHWYPCQGTYSGNDWATGTTYNQGASGVPNDVVRNPNDNRFYACISTHTAGGSFDPSKFAVLTPFNRGFDYQVGYNPDGNTVNPIGEVLDVWDKDPELSLDGQYLAHRISFWLRPTFVQVLGIDPVVWLEQRLRCPVLDGIALPATGAVQAGVTVYDSATGDWWTVVVTTTSGDTPTNAPSKFVRLSIPGIFRGYLARNIYAALSNKEQGQEDFSVQDSAGWPLLRQELDKIERQQRQTRQLRVVGGNRGAVG